MADLRHWYRSCFMHVVNEGAEQRPVASWRIVQQAYELLGVWERWGIGGFGWGG